MTAPSPDERLQQLQHAIDGYPHRVEQLRRRAAEAAERTVTAETGDGQIVVTLTGHGEIQSVRLTHRALRELDSRTLADRVTAAANTGLDRAEALLRPPEDADPGTAGDEAIERFERRMDDLLYELEYVDRKLGHLDD